MSSESAVTAESLKQGNFCRRGFHRSPVVDVVGDGISALSVYAERAVQKCLCDYCIVPIYSSSFIYDNSASLKHRGMDFALRRMICHLQKHYRKHGLAGGILIFDFKSYFDEAPHSPLAAEAKRRLHDDRVRSLHDSFIADFGPVRLQAENKISQTNALLLPSPIDHYFKEKLRIKGYARYMDDGYAIHEDIDFLRTEGMFGLEEIIRKPVSAELEENSGYPAG